MIQLATWIPPSHPGLRCKREHPNNIGRGKNSRRPKKRARRSPSAKKNQNVFFWARREVEFAVLPLSLKTCRPKFYRTEKMSSHILSQGSLRSIEAYISTKLITIHPNPGPRDKTEDGKRRRRERRYEKRREKRNKQTKELDVLKIATWNVQKISLGNKRKAKSVADFTSKMKWDCVLLSEVRAKTKGNT